MQNQKRAYIYAVSAVLFWSTAASAFKLTLRHTTFVELLLFSSCTSLTALFLILVFQGKLRLLGETTRHDFFRSLCMGVLNPFLYYLVLFKAYSLLPAQQALTLNYTWPLMLVLLSIPFLGQKITAKSISAVALSFAGVVIITTHGDFSGLRFTNPAGAVLALGSSVIWGLFWIFNVKDRRDEVVKLFLNFLFGTGCIVLFSLAVSPVSLPRFPWILGAVYVGLFEMGITFVLWLKGLHLSRTTAQVSNLVYISPFLSLFFIRAVVGESIAVSTIIGLVCIMAGIIIQQREGKKQEV
ncbi:DMT family transporter [bacterium]|nr:DMT family transporter [bacterium]